ncbi:MAG: hypothetical protein IJW88_10435, partial [Alistipes sp.]|nr:hypothetical protein [Alistipes sp.]
MITNILSELTELLDAVPLACAKHVQLLGSQLPGEPPFTNTPPYLSDIELTFFSPYTAGYWVIVISSEYVELAVPSSFLWQIVSVMVYFVKSKLLLIEPLLRKRLLSRP